VGYGASRSAWEHFSTTLGLTADLLPLVSNPNAIIAPHSTMQDVGKTPSVLNAEREVVGLAKWTGRISEAADVRRWMREPDYGICIQTRRVRAFDIDVADKAAADAVELAITSTVGVHLPVRFRQGTGKRLLAFRLEQEEAFPKRVLQVGGGIIELLGDGQQFVAEGHHKSGTRYEWAGGLPERIPPLTLDQVEAACSTLQIMLGTAEWKIARERRARDDIDVEASDERAEWLVKHWDVYDSGQSGELYLRCPFEGDHTSDSGPTSTAYFPRGSGGFEQGHWACLHAHCIDRGDAAFDEAVGYRYANFTALPAVTKTVIDESGKEVVRAVRDAPAFNRTPAGKIIADSGQLGKALENPDFCEMWITYDHFLDDLMWAPCDQMEGRQQWQRFVDRHYHELRRTLERKGFIKLSDTLLRASVEWQAHEAGMDSAQEWLARQVWDGTSRIDTFLADYFGVEPSDYTSAVSRYMWSAMAGRVITPGVQADMVPVLCGAQGARKTTGIKALAPALDHYVEINLAGRDDNLSRKLRGKLVGELEELRGLQSRDAEEIKAWITRTHEEWVPKFKERPMVFARRLLLLGTTNHRRFLADSSGERRWLPTIVATHGPIRPEAIARDRNQLWAEAALLYRLDGIQWQEAERLGVKVHDRFKVLDIWSEPVERWLAEPNVAGVRPGDAGFSIGEALACVGMPMGQVTPAHLYRMGRVLTSLSFTEDAKGRWR